MASEEPLGPDGNAPSTDDSATVSSTEESVKLSTLAAKVRVGRMLLHRMAKSKAKDKSQEAEKAKGEKDQGKKDKDKKEKGKKHKDKDKTDKVKKDKGKRHKNKKEKEEKKDKKEKKEKKEQKDKAGEAAATAAEPTTTKAAPRAAPKKGAQRQPPKTKAPEFEEDNTGVTAPKKRGRPKATECEEEKTGVTAPKKRGRGKATEFEEDKTGVTAPKKSGGGKATEFEEKTVAAAADKGTSEGTSKPEKGRATRDTIKELLFRSKPALQKSYPDSAQPAPESAQPAATFESKEKAATSSAQPAATSSAAPEKAMPAPDGDDAFWTSMASCDSETRVPAGQRTMGQARQQFHHPSQKPSADDDDAFCDNVTDLFEEEPDEGQTEKAVAGFGQIMDYCQELTSSARGDCGDGPLSDSAIGSLSEILNYLGLVDDDSSSTSVDRHIYIYIYNM